MTNIVKKYSIDKVNKNKALSYEINKLKEELLILLKKLYKNVLIISSNSLEDIPYKARNKKKAKGKAIKTRITIINLILKRR